MPRKLLRYSLTALSAAAFLSAFASSSAQAQRMWSINAGALTNRPMLNRPAQPLPPGKYVFTTTPDPSGPSAQKPLQGFRATYPARQHYRANDRLRQYNSSPGASRGNVHLHTYWGSQSPAQNAGPGGYPTHTKVRRNAEKPTIAKVNSIKASSIPQLRPNNAPRRMPVLNWRYPTARF